MFSVRFLIGMIFYIALMIFNNYYITKPASLSKPEYSFAFFAYDDHTCKIVHSQRLKIAPKTRKPADQRNVLMEVTSATSASLRARRRRSNPAKCQLNATSTGSFRCSPLYAYRCDSLRDPFFACFTVFYTCCLFEHAISAANWTRTERYRR